jgi:hypothetical protein
MKIFWTMAKTMMAMMPSAVAVAAEVAVLGRRAASEQGPRQRLR